MTLHSANLDTGLQAERTALAWRRTALALLGTAVLLAKLTYELSPTGAIAIALVGTTTAIGLEWMTRRRLTRLSAVIRAGDRTEGAAAGLLALAATVVTVIGGIGAIATFAI